MNDSTLGPFAQSLMPKGKPEPEGGAAHFDRMIEKLAAQKVDFSQIERMYELRDRYLKEEARKAWVRAMTLVKSEPIVVEKRRMVNYAPRSGGRVRYNYAELADYTDALGPAMGKHGLSFRWSTRQETFRDAESGEPYDEVFVRCIVTHEEGHSEETELHGPLDDSGQKNPIQQMGSTISFLQRYTLMQIAGVAARGMDNDGTGGEEEPPDPQQELIDDLYAKMGLSESQGELEKLKPQIESIKNAGRRRNLIGAYRARVAALRGEST